MTHPKKTFLLGVGCQKGGTTWLHSYLRDLPECDFGFMKEYHVLDVHYEPGTYRFEKRLVSKVRDQLRKGEYQSLELGPKKKPRLVNHLYRVGFYNNLDSYFDYFTMLEARSREVSVVGDITPAYGLLPQPAFKKVNKQMTARGFDVKVIFLMRDPIERLHSATRMRLRDRRKSGDPLLMSEDELFVEMLNDPNCAGRSEYHKTIENIEAVFPTESIYYGFFEELFTEREVQKVTDFLGIEYGEPDLGRRVNSTERTSALSDEIIAESRERFAPTYDFVADRFPDRDFTSLWSHA